MSTQEVRTERRAAQQRRFAQIVDSRPCSAASYASLQPSTNPSVGHPAMTGHSFGGTGTKLGSLLVQQGSHFMWVARLLSLLSGTTSLWR
eukprot:1102727-Amphidinium_carterae.1